MQLGQQPSMTKAFFWPLSTAPASTPGFPESPSYTGFPHFSCLLPWSGGCRFLPSRPHPPRRSPGCFPGLARFPSSAMGCVFSDPCSPPACGSSQDAGSVSVHLPCVHVATWPLRRRPRRPPSPRVGVRGPRASPAPQPHPFPAEAARAFLLSAGGAIPSF